MESATITIRTTLELKQKLDMMALEENRTLSNLIDTILKKYVEEHEKRTNKVLLLCNLTYVTHYILYEVVYLNCTHS